MDKKLVLVIDDFYGHGGHVRSFIAQVKAIENYFKDITIVCAESGYVNKNIGAFKNINITNLRLVPLSKLRRWQFSYRLFKAIKYALADNAILHVYTPECYFSALLAKKFFKGVILINSVMGGPHPFPHLRSTDLYIAVSEEQKEYALAYSNRFNDNNIIIIKNRITLVEVRNFKTSNEKIILAVTRFDKDKKVPLANLFSVLVKLPNTCKIVIAGIGTEHKKYVKQYQNYNNMHFVGYCNDLLSYIGSAGLVLGMGRSILEFMLYGIPAVLIGYNGIELLENYENVSFASQYNFAGRRIKDNIGIDDCVRYIIKRKSQGPLRSEIVDFLKNEYLVCCFKEKYESFLKEISPTETTYIQVFKEYFFIFNQRLQRKLR